MRFAHPQILWLLLVMLPALFAFFWWSWRQRQRLVTQFIQARLLSSLTVGVSPVYQRIRLALLVSAVAFLILALARPQWGFSWEEAKQRGLDIVVAIDTSKSMLAEDIAPNRLARAKLAALDLMQQAKSDRLGLVAFAGTAFLQCPLTLDDVAFRQSVEALDTKVIPQGGTALAEAIESALTAFSKSEAGNYKILVLFTDGEDNDTGALEAATKAGKDGLRIFTIGVGTPEGELLRVTDAKGRTDYVRDEQGAVVKSHLNETLLRQIAGTTTNGFYLRLAGAKTIDTLYEQGLAPLPKSEKTAKLVKRYHEQFHWPLTLAILLLVTEMFLPERKRQRQAVRADGFAIKEKTELRETVALLALLVLPVTALASPGSALREYNAGKYDDALKEYRQLLERKADDPRLHFNAGAAAYKNKQFEEAARQFMNSLASPDLQLQEHAYYNLGNTLYQLGERNPDPAKKTDAWENSVKNFESAIKLNPQDADATFNHEFVKKKLEELKQQQQQQSSQDKDKKQDQPNKQNQQSQNDQKNNQEKKSQSGQNQDSSQQNQQQGQKPEQQQADQQKQADAQSQQAQEEKDKRQEKQPAQQQPSNQPGEDSSEKPDQSGEATALAGQMTEQQAQQLLDAQKGQEELLWFKPTDKPPANRNRPLKDW